MPNVFDYLDFRAFLKDFYSAKKGVSPSYSYELMARKAGFKSKGFIHQVIAGKRGLTTDSIFKISKVLGLQGKASNYFEDLVAFNQAKTAGQKLHFFSRMSTYKQAIKARFIQHTQYEYFSSWYHATLRELATIVDFRKDYDRLGSLVFPPITEKQAKEGMDLLMELDLLRHENGAFVQTSRAITTGDEVQSLVVQKFHVQNLALATAALETIPREERDISNMIVGLSKPGFEAVKGKIQRFRKELAELVENDTKAERVYHINFQLFPTSKAAESGHGA